MRGKSEHGSNHVWISQLQAAHVGAACTALGEQVPARCASACVYFMFTCATSAYDLASTQQLQALTQTSSLKVTQVGASRVRSARIWALNQNIPTLHLSPFNSVRLDEV